MIDPNNLSQTYTEIETTQHPWIDDHPPVHKQLYIEYQGRFAHVDADIAETILCLWRMGIETVGSCHGTPPKFSFYIAFGRDVDYLKLMTVLMSYQRSDYDSPDVLFLHTEIKFHVENCACPLKPYTVLYVENNSVEMFKDIIQKVSQSIK